MNDFNQVALSDAGQIAVKYNCGGLVQGAIERAMRELRDYMAHSVDCDARRPEDVVQLTDATQMIGELMPDVMFDISKWFAVEWREAMNDHKEQCEMCQREMRRAV